MSNFKSRVLVFATFFGSLLAIGLLLVSLTTNHWVRSSAKRVSIPESHGEIYYGLFNGIKDLNVGYGLRTQSVHMLSFIQNEPDVMSFWLWLFTALGVGFALLASAIAAIASIIKTASAAKKKGTMILLFVSNISSAMGQIIAFVCWAVQFYQHLIHNVLAAEDRNLFWYTHGLAYFGYSFWLVVLSTIIVIVNLVLLYIAHKHEQSFKRFIEPICEDKNQTAIMLY
ncbi:uncharacterized protein LOC129612031 [Condylostylus longicornis]|uniref:uncharacterized protein LOC129612031 n=1 Tax=Condylostylus longicornis TaxID=2530218 RepID=UPI00244E5986|nr:uncharacterized protein LOC129612031 [Condylostylus longicornis]